MVSLAKKAAHKRHRQTAKGKATNNRAGRKWRKNHPEQAAFYDRGKHLKKKYGLTVDAWNAMFEVQGRRCASCGNTSGKWMTDHNHITGKVRGILCRRCNIALGFIENRLLQAQLEVYLEKHDG